jgi:COP9 signalosome complex subunit 5
MDSKLPSAATEDAPLPADARYHFDADKLQKLRTESPWQKNPKYFDKVAISPSAVMKMMMHCQSGVEKGIAKGGTLD